MDKKPPPKKHADFQDPYRRSSNFRSTVKKERYQITGDGKVILNEDSTD
jgi:hypothetical protein